MLKRSDIKSYTIKEATTLLGATVSFACLPEAADKVKQLIQTEILDIGPTETQDLAIKHGGYMAYSRFKVKQHVYSLIGDDDVAVGFTEVLEIKDPPDNRCGFVIYRHDGFSEETFFVEWETLKDAKNAHETMMQTQDSRENFWSNQPGFKRFVNCSNFLTPWFYATGNRCLVGDFVFPERVLHDDPVFILGKKFLVINDKDLSSVRICTCMGTRFVEVEEKQNTNYPPYISDGSSNTVLQKNYRIVYWHDGTIWDESRDPNNVPKPLEKEKLWVADALEQFNKFLNGQVDHVIINFQDGNIFEGKFTKKGKKPPTVPGEYFITLQVEEETKPRKGWYKFNPTEESPNVIDSVKNRLKKEGKQAQKIEITEFKNDKGKKKWSGVFY
jgi:hypothetical protein